MGSTSQGHIPSESSDKLTITAGMERKLVNLVELVWRLSAAIRGPSEGGRTLGGSEQRKLWSRIGWEKKWRTRRKGCGMFRRSWSRFSVCFGWAWSGLGGGVQG